MKISFSFPLRVLYIAVLVLGLTGFAFAQTSTSEVNGVVKDTSGAVISGRDNTFDRRCHEHANNYNGD